MALTATIHHFTVRLSDVDRGVYETLELKVARHPSEADEYMVARVLAYCLEYAEGIAFSKGGLSDPDEPPLAVRDLTGALKSWVEIGNPDADRLHKAAKAPAEAVPHRFGGRGDVERVVQLPDRQVTCAVHHPQNGEVCVL